MATSTFRPLLAILAGQLVLCVPGLAARKHPVNVYLTHHIDNGRDDVTQKTPTRTSEVTKWLMALYEKHQIKAQLGFVGMVVQQLGDDYPETLAAIKRLKMPVGYHPGGTHTEPCQVGRGTMLPLRGPDDAETKRKNLETLWNFETRTLVPNWRIADGKAAMGNSREDQVMTLDELPAYNLPKAESWLYGGWMAIERVLGIIPMDTDSGGDSLLYEKLGVRSFPYNWGPVDIKKAVRLPPMAEMEVYNVSRLLPYKYYGKPYGVDVPRHPTVHEWLSALADGLPDDQVYLQSIFTHSSFLFGPNRQAWEDMIVYLKSRPGDFRIVWPDSGEAQWRPENSPEAFYKRTYNKTLAEFRTSPPSLDELMKDPRSARRMDPSGAPQGAASLAGLKRKPARTAPLKVEKKTILEIATAVLSIYPAPTHDADYGGPPRFYTLSSGVTVSLADAFQMLARSVVEWGHNRKLPDVLPLPAVRGPIDYPMYKLAQEPKYDPKKIRTGYTPRELPRELFPPPEIVQAQGLPMQAENHLWQAARALIRGDDVLDAAWLAVAVMDEKGHVPGVITVNMAVHDDADPPRRPRYIAVKVNPGEFLRPLAQVLHAIDRLNPTQASAIPSAFIIGLKIIAEQRAMLVLPYSPMTKNGGFHIESLKHQAFVWREQVSPELLDAAWNYTP